VDWPLLSILGASRLALSQCDDGYDRDTNTESGSGGLEVLVEMYEPIMLTAANDLPFGIVRKIITNNGSTPIPYDHIVLSAHGTAADTLAANVQVGDTIGISQKIKHSMQDQCNESNPEDWIGTYASMAGSYYFLRNSVIYDFASVSDATFHQPRTAIAYNDDYVFFIVADGRNPGISEGMTIAELADFVKNTLGATYGIAQDGGGSSTMVINGKVVNNTYCNHTYCTPKIYIPLIVKSGDSSISTQIAQGIKTEWDAEAQILQRLVANGMLMVVVQPMQKSEAYNTGHLVTTLGSVDLYLGPGSNYAVLSSIENDGEIVAPINDLGGVYAKGSYWWKVKMGAYEGWVPEENITPQLKVRRADGVKAR